MSLKQQLEKQVQKVVNLRGFVMACLALTAAGSMTSCGVIQNAGVGGRSTYWGDFPGLIYDGGASRARPIYDGGASRARPIYDNGASRARPIYNNGSSRARPIYDNGASRARPIQRKPQVGRYTVDLTQNEESATQNSGNTKTINAMLAAKKKSDGMA